MKVMTIGRLGALGQDMTESRFGVRRPSMMVDRVRAVSPTPWKGSAASYIQPHRLGQAGETNVVPWMILGGLAIVVGMVVFDDWRAR